MLALSEREQFADRLRQALEQAGQPAKSPTALQRNFNIRTAGAPITTHAARKWIVGEAIPTQEKLQVLAGWLNVAPEWLRYGDGDEPGSGPDGQLAPRTLRFSADFDRLPDRDKQLVEVMLNHLLHCAAAQERTEA